MKTSVTDLYLTNEPSRDKFQFDEPYYERPLVVITVDIENTKTTPINTNIGSNISKLSLSDEQIVMCELVSPDFTGEIPASSTMTVDLYFFPNNKIDLKTLRYAILNWQEYTPKDSQAYEQSITMPL